MEKAKLFGDEIKGSEPSQSVSEAPIHDFTSQNNIQSSKVSTNERVKEFISKKFENILSSTVDDMKEERQSFNLYVAGNYFGEGAKINGNISSQSSKRREIDTIDNSSFDDSLIAVPIEKSRKLEYVYIKNSEYEAAKEVLNEKNILMIVGDPNSGKSSASIHLLFSKEDVHKIYYLNSDLDLAKFKFKENRGYIIQGISHNRILSFLKSEAILERVNQALREISSYLVLCVENYSAIPNRLNLCVLSWKSVQCSKDLLDKHLSWYCQENSLLASYTDVIEDIAIQNLLDQRLTFRDIDELARILLKVLQGEADLQEALQSFQVIVSKQVEDWFDSHSDLDHRLLMVTLSVFHGCRYDQISICRKQLLSIVNRSLGKRDDEKITVGTLNIKLSDYVKEVRAYVDNNGSKNSHYGLVSTDKIFFDNAAFQSAVLSHIWKEYHLYRKPLLVWLCELGFHESSEISIKAAIALGEIAQYAFSEVEEEVIRIWSTHTSDRVKRLAAFTLSIPASSGFDLPIQRLLHVWSRSNNRHRQYTAISSYRAAVSCLSVEYALRDLLFIAESNNTDLIELVVECVVDFFNSGDFFPVLSTLQIWSKPKKDNIESTVELLGICIFWKIMNLTLQFNDSNHRDPPVLLWLSKQDAVYEDLIVDLLRNALNMPIAQSDILDSMFDWLKSLDENPESKLFKSMGRIIFKLIKNGTERERGRLLKKIKVWSVKYKSDSAGKILSVIQGC